MRLSETFTRTRNYWRKNNEIANLPVLYQSEAVAMHKQRDILGQDLYVKKHKDTINLWFEGNTYEINPERTDIEDGYLELKRKEEGK